MNSDNTIIVIDGGMGRELEAQGASIDPPLWSANAFYTDPDIVKNVHKTFIAAGASVITANTYAIIQYHLNNANKAGDQPELLDLAYTMARQARDETHPNVRIAASLPPLSESYRADLVADDEQLEQEHIAHRPGSQASGRYFVGRDPDSGQRSQNDYQNCQKDGHSSLD
jgi:S-methylmethionine-dependent homocysteine/selenocysteine methylase